MQRASGAARGFAGAALVTLALVANGCSGCTTCSPAPTDWLDAQRYGAERRLRGVGKPECLKDSECSMTCPPNMLPGCQEPVVVASDGGRVVRSKGYCECSPLSRRILLTDAGLETCTDKNRMVRVEDAGAPSHRACNWLAGGACGWRDAYTTDVLDEDGGLLWGFWGDAGNNWCKNGYACRSDLECQRRLGCPPGRVAACDLVPELHRTFCDCAPLRRLDAGASAPMHMGCGGPFGTICGRVDDDTGDVYDDEDGGLLFHAGGPPDGHGPAVPAPEGGILVDREGGVW
jgi:hypothetical protein